MYKYLSVVFFAFLTQIAIAQHHKTAVIPFELTAFNNISIKAIVNGKDTVQLMFHTAANSLTLTEEATKRIKNLVFSSTDSVKSWGGNGNASRFSKSNNLQIGSLKWENIPIWENKNSGPETDGKFGLELFTDKIIEIDFDKKVIVLHTKMPAKASKYEQLKLNFEDDMMFLTANAEIGTNVLSNQYLLHSGYSGAVLFDDEFTAKNKIDGQLKVIDEKQLKDSYGNVLKTKKAIMPAFAIGKVKLSNVSIGFFTGAIGRQKMSIIGGDLLKRFNIIIDATRTNIYLKPNKLMVAAYWNG